MASPNPNETPTIITPDDNEDKVKAAKKARRQTAFYPNVNSSNKQQKPFSRSAAKRESVMALGSIEHLQYYFTKTGIAAKKSPSSKAPKGSVPAIGGLTHIKNNSSLSVGPEIILPKTPAIPQAIRPAYPPFVKTYETDPESLLPGVIDDLSSTAHVWKIDEPGQNHDPSRLGGSTSPFDVLGVLKTTTRTIRSIRNYVVSLPDESTGSIRAQFRPKSLQSATPQKPKRTASTSGDGGGPEDPLALIRRSALQVLSVLRELEESSRVPLSDDAYDAQSDHGSSNGRSSPSRVASPSNMSAVSSDPPDQPPEDILTDPDNAISFSLVQVHGRYESVPVWAQEEDSYNLSEEEGEKKELWDERLVLGGGWLYKQDITLDSLVTEREVIGRYLDVVDAVLFGGKRGDGEKRGWEKERLVRLEKASREGRSSKAGRRTPFGPRSSSKREVSKTRMMDESMVLTKEPETFPPEEDPDSPEEEDDEGSSGGGYVSDSDLPNWAKRTTFLDSPLVRAHALLTHALPTTLLSSLPSPQTRLPFLESLTSGQLLCVAYNACVRKSKKPWGFVNKDAIHDIVALNAAQSQEKMEDKEERDKARREWTFRRTDNLRLWIGALKLRYLLPITSPQKLGPTNTGPGGPVSSPVASPSMQRFPSNEVPIIFDAPLVARRDEGWDGMLEEALLRWVKAVVDEKRVYA